MHARRTGTLALLTTATAALALVASACVTVYDPGPPAGQEGYKAPRNILYDPTYVGYDNSGSWVANGCRFTGNHQANNAWGNYVRTNTNGPGCTASRHKSETRAKFYLTNSTYGNAIMDCSTLSMKCVNVWNGSTANHWISRGDNGRYTEINMGPGSDAWYNYTRHILRTPNSLYVKYLVGG